MLEARFQKRLRALGMKTFDDYCAYLFSPEGMEHELHHMIDTVTTNKTDFFREPSHFEFLVNTVLPEMTAPRRAGAEKKLRIWSAGCSTGEEPYTLAMVINEFAERYPSCGFAWSILATDISTKVLEKARQAVFDRERVMPIPDPLKRKYLLKSKDRNKGLVRIVPELRQMVCFRRLNFMDDDFGFRENDRRHLLPERHHLLRPAHPDETAQQVLPADGPGRVSVHGALGDAPWAGCAPGSGDTDGIQEAGMSSRRTSRPLSEARGAAYRGPARGS